MRTIVHESCVITAILSVVLYRTLTCALFDTARPSSERSLFHHDAQLP